MTVFRHVFQGYVFGIMIGKKRENFSVKHFRFVGNGFFLQAQIQKFEHAAKGKNQRFKLFLGWEVRFQSGIGFFQSAAIQSEHSAGTVKPAFCRFRRSGISGHADKRDGAVVTPYGKNIFFYARPADSAEFASFRACLYFILFGPAFCGRAGIGFDGRTIGIPMAVVSNQ